MTKAALVCLFAGIIMFTTGQVPTLSLIVMIVGGLLLLAAIIRYRNAGTEPSALPSTPPSGSEPKPTA